MAWRSSGTTNEEMVDKLCHYHIITSPFVESSFRAVDRLLFVPPDNEEVAYTDQPLREGNVHISAPHIYGNALEALELKENSAMSFLNVGSGTGYLSCIIAQILGPKSLNYGIEIHEDVVEHCNKAVANWRESRNLRNESDLHMEIIHGNAFHVSCSEGETIVGFDRIYIGAAVSRANLSKITKLLSPGGILVGPVDDELLKVIRIGSASPSSSSSVGEFTEQVLSGVRFAPLSIRPPLKTVIPARLWGPSTQKHFPATFQNAINQILMCSKSNIVQPVPRIALEDRINTAALLPRHLWMEILSFTHRKWFDSEQTQVELLQTRLKEEQENTARCMQAQAEAEARCFAAEHERDMYKMLARRWETRLNQALQQAATNNNNGANAINRALIEAASSITSVGSLSLENILHNRNDESDDNEEEEAGEQEDDDSNNSAMRMSEDEDNGIDTEDADNDENHDMDEDDDLPWGSDSSSRSSSSDSDDSSAIVYRFQVNSDQQDSQEDSSISRSQKRRRADQIRTVSLGSADSMQP